MEIGEEVQTEDIENIHNKISAENFPTICFAGTVV
jgi:hypothetical protein